MISNNKVKEIDIKYHTNYFEDVIKKQNIKADKKNHLKIFSFITLDVKH